MVQAHIHCGPLGVNGGIFVWLFPSVTSTAALTGPTGPQNGVLAEGTVTSGATLNVRTVLASDVCPGGVANFADALRQIRSGNAYVNIHTNDGVAPTNTGRETSRAARFAANSRITAPTRWRDIRSWSCEGPGSVVAIRVFDPAGSRESLDVNNVAVPRCRSRSDRC